MKTPPITAEQVLPLWVTTLKALRLSLRTPYPPERKSLAEFYVATAMFDVLGSHAYRQIQRALGYAHAEATHLAMNRRSVLSHGDWHRSIRKACVDAFETGRVIEIAPLPPGERPSPSPIVTAPAPLPTLLNMRATAAPPPTRTMTDIAKSVAASFPKRVMAVRPSPAPSEPQPPHRPFGKLATGPKPAPITTTIKRRPDVELKPDGSNIYAVPLIRRNPANVQGVSVPVPGDKPEGWKPPPHPKDAPEDADTVTVKVKISGDSHHETSRQKSVTLPRIRALEGRDDG